MTAKILRAMGDQIFQRYGAPLDQVRLSGTPLLRILLKLKNKQEGCRQIVSDDLGAIQVLLLLFITIVIFEKYRSEMIGLVFLDVSCNKVVPTE